MRARSFILKLLRNPITGIVGCCARALSGHVAAPPIRVISSRRFIVLKSRHGVPASAGTPDRKTLPRRETAALRNFNTERRCLGESARRAVYVRTQREARRAL